MKNIITCLLLFLFTVNPMVFYVVLELHKLRISEEIVKNNQQEPITLLAIPDSVTPGSFHWEDDNEFTYQGKYYDVLRQEKKDGYILFYCINDKREENLAASLKKIVVNKIVSFFVDDVVKIVTPGNSPDQIIPFSDFLFPLMTKKLNSINPPALSPPPKQS